MKAFFKTGVATGAAFLALFGGAQVAQAGIGDGVGDAIGAIEGALPNPEETDLDAVAEEATEAVDDATGLVDAEAAVSDTKGAVDAAVADPKETAENAVEQAKSKVGNPTGIVKDIAEKTPAGKVVNGVTESPRSGRFEHRLAQGAGWRSRRAIRSGATRGRAEAPPRPFRSKLPRARRPSPKAAPGATLTLGRPGSIASSVTALIARNGATAAQSPGRARSAAGSALGEAGQGFLRGSGCTVRSASSWRPARDGPLRRRGSRSRTSRCAFRRALLLGPEDRPIGSAWTEPRTG